MADFLRACAAADLWLHCVKASCSAGPEQNPSDQHRRLAAAIKQHRLTFLSGSRPASRVPGPENFVKAAHQLAGKCDYRNVEAKTLVRQLWKQAELCRWVRETKPL